MVKVYFEYKNSTELIAVFEDENVYNVAFKGIQEQANKQNAEVTEDIEPYTLEEYNKDLGLFIAYVYKHNLGETHRSGLFESYDDVYKMAKDFLESYPPDTDWESLKETKGDYDEIVEEFVEQYIKKLQND